MKTSTRRTRLPTHVSDSLPKLAKSTLPLECYQHTTFRPEIAAEHQTSCPPTNIGHTGEHHRSHRSLLVKLGDFHRKAPHRSGRCNTAVRPVQHTCQTGHSQKSPKHQTGLPTSKQTQTRNSPNTRQQQTHPDVHPSKNPPRVPPVRPV
jgi:hypothetical protein